MVRTTTLVTYLMRGLFLAMCALLLVYFGYHAVIGDRGLLAWFQLERQAEELQAELAVLKAERERIEHRVTLMRPESLDPDMLDKRAREVLNLTHPSEITILRSVQ